MMSSVASTSAKISSDSLRHDLSLYRRRMHLRVNALEEDLVPEAGEPRRINARHSQIVLTRKRKMGQSIRIAKAESIGHSKRRDSEASVPTIKAAFSDFNVSRRISEIPSQI
jgi:hypothetical protein